MSETIFQRIETVIILTMKTVIIIINMQTTDTELPTESGFILTANV